MADIPAQLRQRNEDLARVRDQIAVRRIAHRSGNAHQRTGIGDTGQRERLFIRKTGTGTRRIGKCVQGIPAQHLHGN
jgi:hypothetical protein